MKGREEEGIPDQGTGMHKDQEEGSPRGAGLGTQGRDKEGRRVKAVSGLHPSWEVLGHVGHMMNTESTLEVRAQLGSDSN